MIERPIYRALDIAPGQRYFNCQPLRASINTAACAQRWASAETTAQCHECKLGRLHHSDHHPTKQPRLRKANVSACLCCDRTDLRTIKVTGLCVSCHNRQQEWIKGRNAKGKMPVLFEPLRAFEITVQLADASEQRHLVEADHDAEAIGLVLRDMPAGASIQSEERREVAWNASTREFEHVCTRCGAQGLILERVRSGQRSVPDAKMSWVVFDRVHHGRLEYWQWCCSGEPEGPDWRLAEVRKLPFALPPEGVAAWLNTGAPELGDETEGVWKPTEHPCVCGSGLVEGMLSRASGRWQCRCKACGASSE